MILKKKISSWAYLTSVILFTGGLTTFRQLLKLLEPNVEGIEFVITGSLTAFLFSPTLGLIPILTFITWQLSGIDLLYRKIFSISIIILTIAAALFTRRQEVKIFFNSVVRPLLLTNGKTHAVYPIDPRNFVYYLFGGLLSGCILSFLILRQKNIRPDLGRKASN
ncbi:MAG: hypothetical protein ABJB86_02925 [Bacteroidota bacterium]